MLPTFKSEFRKLFTIRSTYIIMALSFGLIALFCLYFEGYKGNSGSPAANLTPMAFQEIISNGAGLGALFATIIAILFMAHEYRYNTIMYTLTANARRTKVLFVKVMTIVIFCVIYGLVAAALALGLYKLGLSFRDANLPAQNFDLLPQLGKLVFYYAGYALIGLLIATATRSVVVAIGTLLIFPTTVEPLLGLLLKDNSKFLPFTSLDSTIGASMAQNALSSGTAIVVSAAYLAVGLLVTWLLFVRRDAN